MGSIAKDFSSHYTCHILPFTREIPVDKLFLLPFLIEAGDALLSALRNRMCVALFGPAGVGKSVLIRWLISKLPESRFRIHYVKVADLSKRDMCREIADIMGVVSSGNYPTLVRRLQDRFLILQDNESVRPIIVIDDAHHMRPDVLSLLSVLTNFEMDSRLVVSILLAGQPPLRRALEREELEEVTGRLAHLATLRLLSREESRDYIKHRVNIAGMRSMPFDDQALEALYETSRGNLRAIDQIALKTLEVAHARGCKVADSNHVAEARKLVCL